MEYNKMGLKDVAVPALVGAGFGLALFLITQRFKKKQRFDAPESQLSNVKLDILKRAEKIAPQHFKMMRSEGYELIDLYDRIDFGTAKMTVTSLLEEYDMDNKKLNVPGNIESDDGNYRIISWFEIGKKRDIYYVEVWKKPSKRQHTQEVVFNAEDNMANFEQISYSHRPLWFNARGKNHEICAFMFYDEDGVKYEHGYGYIDEQPDGGRKDIKKMNFNEKLYLPHGEPDFSKDRIFVMKKYKQYSGQCYHAYIPTNRFDIKRLPDQISESGAKTYYTKLYGFTMNADPSVSFVIRGETTYKEHEENVQIAKAVEELSNALGYREYNNRFDATMSTMVAQVKKDPDTVRRAMKGMEKSIEHRRTHTQETVFATSD